MSNKLTDKDRESVERALAEYKTYGSFWEAFINRWETTGHQHSERILTSLKRQTSIRRKQSPDDAFSASVGVDLRVLFIWINHYVREMEKPAIRPKERKEIIDRIGENAKQIIRDMVKVGLPSTSTPYFTKGEISGRYQQLLPHFGLSKLIDESQSFDHEAFIEIIKKEGIPDDLELSQIPVLINLDDTKKAIEMAELDQLRAVDLSTEDVLVKLTDEQLLDSLAIAADVSKIESENYQRIYIIRKLTQAFSRRYGEGLQETTARICVLIFDDESIDRDTVRSALSGFSPKPEYNQNEFLNNFRLAEILGNIEEGMFERIQRNTEKEFQ